MILMVVALPSEAKPLCKRYGLKLRCERPFKVFENERVALIQSGVGVESSATAVGYLGALFGNDTRNAWFNIASNYTVSSVIYSLRILLIKYRNSGAAY